MLKDEVITLFFPQIVERRKALKLGMRLVHYTSAEAAYRIIESQQIWLRNASMMNDFSEIQHGISCLAKAWHSPAGQRFRGMLDRLKLGLQDELVKHFDGHADALRTCTFITSLSEHDDKEDELGRLSMWRAYGGRAGVALVLNNTAFAGTTDVMQVFSSPVFYKNLDEFTDWFRGWSDCVIAKEQQLQSLAPETVRDLVFIAFRNFALCTKHPGFAEEREWRIFHSSVLEGTSDWLEQSTEIVGGVPQLLVKLKLFDDAARDITGVHPSTLINRVIIGPCNHPLQIREALAVVLKDAGVPDPFNKLWMSLIPLRQ